jgi:hypothetical protein
VAVRIGFLVGIHEHHPVPVGVGERRGDAEALLGVEEERSRYRVADLGRVLEAGALPRIGLERLAFLDAQRLEHGHKEAVAFLNGVVDDCGEPRLVFDAARRGRGDRLAGHGYDL